MHPLGTLGIALLLSASLGTSFGEAQAQTRSERKAIDEVAPVYPAMAERAHIKGVVKMEVVVRANGSVKSVKVLGGSPVLIASATDAVRKWKFEPGPIETTEIVSVAFGLR
jgi:TonB family protein